MIWKRKDETFEGKLLFETGKWWYVEDTFGGYWMLSKKFWEVI